jgi:hypothetical protein
MLQPGPAAEGSFPKPVKTMKEINMLINAARKPNNWLALRKVKALLRVAHGTAKDDRTPVQKHLIAKWRSVEWDDGSNGVGYTHTRPQKTVNPLREDPPEVWQAFYTDYPEALVPNLGIRRNNGGAPVLSDVKASRIVSQLRPDKTTGPLEASVPFKPTTARLFSVHGAYQEALMRLRIDIAHQVTYMPYNGPSDLTLDNVASHFAACGITLAVADSELGPWARQYLSVIQERA